jgi:hypothetical protein
MIRGILTICGLYQGMKKYILIAIILLVVTALLAAPNYLAHKLEVLATQQCPTCELKIGKASLLGGLKFSDVDLKMGNPKTFQTEIKVESIAVSVAVTSLFSHKIVIENCTIEKPKIVLTNGDEKTPHHDDKEESEWTFQISGLEINDGDFAYVRNHEGTHAVLEARNIDAKFGTISNEPQYLKELVEFELSGQLERSGKTKVKVATTLFTSPPHTEVQVEIQEQKIGDMTKFLKPNAGVMLAGELLHAENHIVARGSNLESKISGEFKNLAITFVPTPERKSLGAALMNAGSDIAVKSENVQMAPNEQTATIQAKREKDESYVSFILRGLKEAAIKLSLKKV